MLIVLSVCEMSVIVVVDVCVSDVCVRGVDDDEVCWCVDVVVIVDCVCYVDEMNEMWGVGERDCGWCVGEILVEV